jgi:Ca-activated chloride channel family protein
VLFVLQRYSAWARRKQLARIAAPQFLQQLTRSHSPVRRMVKEVLLLLSVAGIGVALSRPQWGEHEDRGRTLGQDIVFALDCSRSMLAADVNPSRLQRAKLALMQFVRREGRGRVGLVAFAGQSFLQCPLTFDYGAFQETLQAVDDKTIPIAGTDIGRAVEEAVHAMDKNAKQKIIVLLTDGEDLEKSGVQVAQTMAKEGVVIFTLGVGTPAGAEVQVVNDVGKVETLRDEKGAVVHSRLDETTLRAIAQATGGAYYPLGQLGEGLSKVGTALERAGSPAGVSPSRKFGVDRFHLPVAVVLLLLVGESLLGTRRYKPA